MSLRQPLRLHWSVKKPNFGDALSPLICEAISGRQIEYASVQRCEMFAIGSLLHRLPEHFLIRRKHIWGSGFIDEHDSYHSKHHVYALRGKLSTEIMSISNERIAIGDPGLLADQLIVLDKTDKRHRVGIIEHYKDRQHPSVDYLMDMLPGSIRLDVFTDPKVLLRQIQKCDLVLSSAMHGLIAADSLGVPNTWLKLSDALRGNDFKFRDYYSVFGLGAAPMDIYSNHLNNDLERYIDGYQRPGIDQIKSDLIAHFPSIS